MNAPDFIWACDEARGECRVCFTSPSLNYSTPYVHRDPAVLAELPEVKALVAAGMARVAHMAARWTPPLTAYRMGKVLSALTPADAKAALDRMLQEARNKALGDALGLVRGRGQPGVIIYGDPAIEAIYQAVLALIPEVKP